MADSLRQPWRILECVCSEETAQQRLERDSNLGDHSAENRNYQLYLAVKKRFEAITLPKTVIDTNRNVEVCTEEALKMLKDYGMD
jgi:thymidylate kinase